jgi:23S rRNA (pseudouridine1915-N3)-methyltransferase
MGIMILTVGKRQSDELSAQTEEYLKRISPFAVIKVKYIKDSGELKDDRKSTMKQESERLLEEMSGYRNTVLLDREGESISSEDFAGLLGTDPLCFIIGGSFGVDERVKKSAWKKISFSEMTFPHKLFRVMLLEQIYRGFTIRKKMRYHK